MIKLLDSLRLPRLGASGDHPLASPREAATIFAELRASEPMKALEEVGDWLESLGGDDKMRPERRFEIVRQLDETAQPHRVRLARDGATNKPSKALEARLWQIHHDLWLRLVGAYDDLLDRVERREKGAESLKREAPLIAVRAIRAGAARMKWLYVRYGPIGPEIWAAMARAYRFVEGLGVQQTRLHAYPGIGGETTPEEEYLRALLMSASAPDALTPVEIEVAERLIATTAPRFRLTFQANPDSTYWIDMAHPQAPQRLAAPPPMMTPGLRFFATAAGHTDIQSLLERLEKAGEMPRGIDAATTTDPVLVGRVLKHLRQNWAPRPPVRKSERRRLAAQVSVLHGFDNLLGLLRPSELDLDFGAPPAAETWAVENLSGGGFGAVLAQNVNTDWLRIGCLVCTQPASGGKVWDLGVVRRIARDLCEGDRVEVHVGVQVLSRSPQIGVFTTNIGRWANGVATVDGIVVPDTGEPGGVLVALPPGMYLPGEQLLSVIGGRRHLMFPVGLVDRGADYDLIKFRAMVQDR
jgi:hypothetical protein